MNKLYALGLGASISLSMGAFVAKLPGKDLEFSGHLLMAIFVLFGLLMTFEYFKVLLNPASKKESEQTPPEE